MTHRSTVAGRGMAAVFRRVPVRSGLTPLSFNVLTNRIFATSSEPQYAKMWDGTPIEVDLNDYHGRILYLFGTNDPKVSLTTNALLEPGDVFLDIGANYSTIGLMAAAHVGPDGVVHLFEPQTYLADRVQAAIRAGNHSNVQLHRVGLMDVNGQFTMRGPKNHSGMATFVDHEDSEPFLEVETCEVRAINSYVAPLVEDRPFAAKIDIEGSEPKIMPWIVAQPNLRFLVFEAAHHHRALYDMVADATLSLFGLNQNVVRMRVTRVDSYDEMRQFHDLVAVRSPHRLHIAKSIHPDALAAALRGAK